jgi:hypothetical protein
MGKPFGSLQSRDSVEDNAAVEIHDSTLESIETHSEVLVAMLSAYVHRSSGRPGIDAGTGWSQTVRLRFRWNSGDTILNS